MSDIDSILAELEADATSEAAALFTALVTEYLDTTRAGHGPVSTSLTSIELAERFDEPLPHHGLPLADVVARLKHDVVADKEARTPFSFSEQIGARVCRQARTFGLLVRPLGDVLVIMPPLTISLEELDVLVDVLIRCIRIVTERAGAGVEVT